MASRLRAKSVIYNCPVLTVSEGLNAWDA